MSSTNSSTVWRPAFKDKDEQGNQVSDRLDCKAAAAHAGTMDLLPVLQDEDSLGTELAGAVRLADHSVQERIEREVVSKDEVHRR